MSTPTKEEIHAQIDAASDVANDDDNAGMFGMSYEEGVRDALEWAICGGEPPIE